MLMSLRTLPLVLLAALIAACGPNTALNTPEPTPLLTEVPVNMAMFERGVEVYRANYCGSCHTLDAANTRGTFGPNHDNAYSNAAHYITFDTYTGDAITAEDYIRESILIPTIFYTPGYETTNHHMPAFGHLPEEDIDALVYLLVQQNNTESNHKEG